MKITIGIFAALIAFYLINIGNELHGIKLDLDTIASPVTK